MSTRDTRNSSSDRVWLSQAQHTTWVDEGSINKVLERIPHSQLCCGSCNLFAKSRGGRIGINLCATLVGIYAAKKLFVLNPPLENRIQCNQASSTSHRQATTSFRMEGGLLNMTHDELSDHHLCVMNQLMRDDRSLKYVS